MVQIKNQLVSDTPYKHGTSNKKLYVTVHETDNLNKGAGAQNHADLQTNGNSRAAAWHWQVDDKIAIKSFDHKFSLWAGGDSTGNGNMNSIHVEICVNSDSNYIKACENAAELVKKIMKDEGIPASRVVQHNHWSGKHCPRKMRDGNAGVTWSRFKNMVDGASGNTSPSKPSKPTTSWTKVTGNWTGQTLGNGEYGEPVEQLQTMLAENDPPFYPNKGANNNGIDSYYGDDTEDAVRRFQGYYGLDKDGLAGKQVYSKLNGSVETNKALGGGKSISKLVEETKAGKHGNGAERKKSLGSNYQAVIDVINGKTSASNKTTSGQSVSQMASKIINDSNAPTGHEARRKWLSISNSEYEKVRKEVNKRL